MLSHNVIIADNKCILGYKDKEIKRTYNISTLDSKPYYFLTDYLDKTSIYSNKQNGFALRGHIVSELNEFKRGITNRIKYKTPIPQYEDQKSYILNLKTIKIDDDIKYANIIEYNGKKNNFNFTIVSSILSSCKYKLLLKIESFTITHTNVYFNIRLVRIFPETFDTIDDHKKIYILGQLNTSILNNIYNYEKLNSPIEKSIRVGKQQIKDELKNEFKKQIKKSSRP